DTRAAECAAWPVRSSFHAPHRQWPAAPRRRGYSVAGSGAPDSGRAGALRWPGSGRSAASPGPGSGRSSSPGSAATSRAPCGLVFGTAAGAEPAPPSGKPAGDFRLRTGCLRWLLEKPRSAPGSASLLRARWLSILSMPPAPGSSCIGKDSVLRFPYGKLAMAMKQLIQNVSTGRAAVVEVPAPHTGHGELLVRVGASLISAGTEKMVVEFAEKNLVQKALARPDLVRQVLDKARREGILSTLGAVRTRLDSDMALGYSVAGTVIDVGPGVSGFQMGDRVAC